MGRIHQDVTDAELSVLRVLWDQGSCTIRQITQQVYPSNTDSDYATVKKLLSRLEQKNFVRRQREQIAHEFAANVSLDELLDYRLQDLADDLCGGSQTPLLMHLLQNKKISSNQQKQLRELIRELTEKQDVQSRRKGGRK